MKDSTLHFLIMKGSFCIIDTIPDESCDARIRVSQKKTQPIQSTIQSFLFCRICIQGQFGTLISIYIRL